MVRITSTRCISCNDHLDKNSSVKVLFDAVEADFIDVKTLNSLAKIARNKFDSIIGKKKLTTAVLNKNYNSVVSETEHWFLTKNDALNWLNNLT